MKKQILLALVILGMIFATGCKKEVVEEVLVPYYVTDTLIINTNTNTTDTIIVYSEVVSIFNNWEIYKTEESQNGEIVSTKFNQGTITFELNTAYRIQGTNVNSYPTTYTDNSIIMTYPLSGDVEYLSEFIEDTEEYVLTNTHSTSTTITQIKWYLRKVLDK